MDVLEFRGPHGWLQIFSIPMDGSKSKLAEQGLQHLRHSAGGHGFSGAGNSFVSETDLRAFCESLAHLSDGVAVGAHLTGHEVRGLSLSSKPGPEVDRISVEGRIVSNAYRTLKEEDGLYRWTMEFGFWVERHRLANADGVRWVQRYSRR